MISILLWPEHRVNIAKFLQKNKSEKKMYFYEVSEKIIPELSDTSGT